MNDVLQDRMNSMQWNVGLIEGRDFTIIRPVPGEIPTPPAKKEGGPHIYFFEAGLSNTNTGVAVKMHSTLIANEAFEVAGANSPDSVFCASSALRSTDAARAQNTCAALIRLDDVLPSVFCRGYVDSLHLYVFLSLLCMKIFIYRGHWVLYS